MPSNDLFLSTSMVGKTLYVGTLTTSSTDLLAPTANHGQIIQFAMAANTSAAAATITITMTMSGGATKTMVPAFSIPAGTAVRMPELVGHRLGPGDKVSAQSNTASAINVALSGTENT